MMKDSEAIKYHIMMVYMHSSHWVRCNIFGEEDEDRPSIPTILDNKSNRFDPNASLDEQVENLRNKVRRSWPFCVWIISNFVTNHSEDTKVL